MLPFLFVKDIDIEEKMKIRYWVAIFVFVAGCFGMCNIKRVYVSNLSSFIDHKRPRILITSTPEAFGELYAANRISDTLAKLGYGTAVVISNFNPFYTHVIDFDFVINLMPECKTNPNIFNFMLYNMASLKLTRSYNAILSAVPENIVRTNANSRNVVQCIPIRQFYVSAKSAEFCATPKKRLFFGGHVWDKYRGVYCAKLYRLLDQTDYFDVYGPREVWKKRIGLRSSYRGLIADENDKILHVMQKIGVSLVLHSDEHIANNTTSPRIFEACAASNVLICDRLPFIVENFGDTVLYIDRNASPEEMFRQIDNHMRWIQSHQKEAIELARKSHKIFMEKFTLEKMLQNTIDFYKKHKNDGAK